MKDLTSMIRSFHDTAYSVILKQAPTPGQDATSQIEEWAASWYKSVSAIFLKSYLDAMSGIVILPTDKERFEAYLPEMALFELLYELNNRPGSAIIPLRGILDLLDPPPAKSDEPRNREGGDLPTVFRNRALQVRPQGVG